ncbi:MAG: DUF2254 domain-containing protein [Bacteroidota bacterium]|nr:DUF2254 domain-containing protein [Bacteroidota bacterium]
MKTHLRKLFDSLRSNYWFMPFAMMLVSIVVWLGTSTIDSILTYKDKAAISWLYVDTIDSMRTLLLTIEGTIIGIVGVVFSIMMVPLTIAASQFGPRLLRTFLRDKGTQMTLGTFTSTFIFCMLVLLQLRGVHDRHLPQISATFGLMLGICSFGVLIFFINHVAISIQVSVLVTKVSKELHTAIEHDLPDRVDGAMTSNAIEDNLISFDATKPGKVVNAVTSGYLQARDDEGLLRFAKKHNLVLQLVIQPGEFVIQGTSIAIVWPAELTLDKVDIVINEAFIFGAQRTLIQDITFGLNELAEVAVRALSPAINDPFTAMTCIDWLGSALCEICKRTPPKAVLFDDTGTCRIIRSPATFVDFADAAFSLIREYSYNSKAVTLRLMATIAAVIPFAKTGEQLKVLLRHAALIEHGCSTGLPQQADREEVKAAFQKILAMPVVAALQK